MKPLVSVCMATYDHEPFISQAVESVLMQQTDFEFELLIGEDESQDGSRVICEQFERKYPERISLVLGKRSDVIYVDGIPTGRFNLMKLLARAQGEYIALCEGDDYWTDERKLHTQVNFLESHTNYSGSCHYTKSLNADGSEGRVFGSPLVGDINVEDTISTLSPFHTSSFVFRRNRLPENFPDWFKKIISADMALFMMVAKTGPIRMIPECMSVYRKHAGGLTNHEIALTRFHSHRIDLMNYFKEYLGQEYETTIDQVIQSHRSMMSKSSPQDSSAQKGLVALKELLTALFSRN